MSLGVDEATAFKDACKMEHDISEETFQALKKHYLEKEKRN
jgi:Mn-dependent DtxR family transcriptional regulator